jgi:cytidylate kinase
VAAHFGFAHLDTGLLYRAVGAKGGDPVAAAEGLTEDDLTRDDLRTLAAGQAASKVAVIPEVRAALVAFQRQFARRAGGAVLDGRDIGTVICPEAEVKLYVTASAEVRAHRRWLEVGGDEGQVLAEVKERDARDMGRADAPLRPAEDAIVIDTSRLSIAEAAEAAFRAVEQAFGRIIIRRTRAKWFDFARRYRILIDGKEVARLWRGAEIAVRYPAVDAVIEARIDWCSAPRLSVKVSPGEDCVIEVANAKGLVGTLSHNELRDPGNYLTLKLISGQRADPNPWG